MNKTVKLPAKRLIALLILAFALLLTPLFAHTANASTLDYGSASYGDLGEVESVDGEDDLFGKRKKKKKNLDPAVELCQNLKSQIVSARFTAFTKPVISEQGNQQKADARALYNALLDEYERLGCEALIGIPV